MSEDDWTGDAMAACGIGAWRLHEAAAPLRLSDAARRLLGLGAGEPAPTAAALLALLQPLERARLAEALQAGWADGTGFDLELTLRLPSAALQPLRMLGRAQQGPAGRLLLGVLQPVTARFGAASLQLAVGAAGVGLFEIDLASGETRWSDVTLGFYGLPPGAPSPSRAEWRERYLHPDDRARAEARFAAFAAGAGIYELEYRIRRAGDGATRWLHTRGAFADAGRRHAVGVTLDITERRQAEAAARQAWHLLDLSSAQAGFGFGWRTPGAPRGEASPQLKRLYGLGANDPTPSTDELLAMVLPEDRDAVRQALTAPAAPGEVRHYGYRLRRADGQVRRFAARSALQTDAQGGAPAWVYVVIDVTELHAREDELAALHRQLREATEASGIGTWERDPVTGQGRWNDVTCRLFDLPPGTPALSRDDYLQRIHPDDRELLRRFQRRPADDLSPIELEFRILRRDGSVRWLASRGRAERLASGRVRRVGVVFDVTERKRAEAALQAQQLAERANAAKTEFLSRMSHELRTPLNAMLGFAQILSLPGSEPLSPTQRVQLQHIETAGWHLLALINDVLDLARIESRQAVLQPQCVRLAEVVEACVALVEGDARAAGIALRRELAQDLPEQVYTDPTRLRQVLLNLLSNGVKYNRPGGWVALALAREADAASPAGAGWLRITASDNGLGMSDAQLARLFEPFNRLGRERSGVEGTGIGLSLTRHLVELQGGRIGVDSEVGQGSRFVVRLPLAGLRPPGDAGPSPPPPADLAGTG